ncbi:MAG: type II toxin-antitoxin system RelE/ParE family toxin [Rickettsiales bacterium]|jgi:mRNA-degrading endonuclease RelE of RelBE toxin-antitoxin system|nr:type II toxin-antitoxin system RelE/ParE family toxin [Rickettsiales bacterium]
MIAIRQTRQFEKTYKKLHSNQKTAVDKAIRAIASDPDLGERKKGDLASVRVYKFSMLGQLTLLGYSYVEGEATILLLAVGSHENFYRDLKKH